MPKAKTNAPQREHNRNGRAESGGARFGNRKRASIEWTDIPSAEIGAFVQCCNSAGCAVILGRTSDGGALSVTILDGDERIREYPATVEAFGDLSSWVQTMFETP